jgi:hypothetical protein
MMTKAKTKITYRLDLPNADVGIFMFDEKRTWKRDVVRGYDIAELIAEDIWRSKSETVEKLHILSPATYAGLFDIRAELEPTFYAKRVDIGPIDKKPPESHDKK